DTITVDSNGAAAGGTVDNILSGLTINGQGNTNILTLEDSGDTTADTVTVTPTQIGAATGNNFFGAGGSLSYSGLGSGPRNMGGRPPADTLTLPPSSTPQFFATANSPAPPTTTGDSLTLDLTGVTGATLTPGAAGAGQWTFGNRQSVSYTGVEKV